MTIPLNAMCCGIWPQPCLAQPGLVYFLTHQQPRAPESAGYAPGALGTIAAIVSLKAHGGAAWAVGCASSPLKASLLLQSLPPRLLLLTQQLCHGLQFTTLPQTD